MAEKTRVLTFLGSGEARLLVGALLGSSCTVSHGSADLRLLETIRAHEPELVLVDMELPEISGLEVVCRIRRDPLYQELLIVGLGTEDVSGMDKVALVAGCTGFVYYPLQPSSFPAKIRAFLQGERSELDLREHLQYYRLFSEILTEKLETRLATLERKTRVLEEERERQNNLTLQVLSSLVTLIEAKDPYLKGHSGRVTRYAMALGKRLGLQGEDLTTLHRAALLHDIGKISIDLKQINKPGPLSTEEWAIIRQHPDTGYKILSAIDFLQDEAKVTLYHHTRHEAYGDLPHIPSRLRTMTSIMTLVDSFDAMTTRRSYNQPLSLPDAILELRRCAGTHFDPVLVEAFVSALDDLSVDGTEEGEPLIEGEAMAGDRSAQDAPETPSA
jgi:putative two-component system response regulator